MKLTPGLHSGDCWQCRPVINKPPPLKRLNIRIPILIPIKGRGFLIRGLHKLFLSLRSVFKLHSRQLMRLRRVPVVVLGEEVAHPSLIPLNADLSADLLVSQYKGNPNMGAPK